jgi:hypothetical protein
MVKAKDKVIDAAGSARPYVDRAIHDQQLRENLRNAFDAARDVYGDLVGGRGVTTVASRVATDKDIQENLKKAVDELRHAADRIQGKEEHRGRNSTLLFLGIVLGILFNPMTGPDTRKWLKDRLFGGGNEFSYEPTSGNSN